MSDSEPILAYIIQQGGIGMFAVYATSPDAAVRLHVKRLIEERSYVPHYLSVALDSDRRFTTYRVDVDYAPRVTVSAVP